MVEEIMTIEECAKYLKTSVSTIYKLAQEGKIPASKVGNQWRFRKEEIDNWLDREEQFGKTSVNSILH
ncbi:helix-turn-helix domain-containing protein [Thermodesulfovibrionales bacterium]|nr:helix-turn-helix domain-containing protein [Thermodesulfovibrionales bacterium]